MAKEYLNWKCHTPRLFEEMMINPGMQTFKQPLKIFRALLVQVAERATELNDDKLNLLMLRLTLYDCADPAHERYDPTIIDKLEAAIAEATKE